MARQFDAAVETAIRRASAAIVDRGQGSWTVALDGVTARAQARVRDGWFLACAPLPDALQSTYDDLWALRVNAHLRTRARIARPCGLAPLVKADVAIDRANPFDLVRDACVDLTHAMQALSDSKQEWQPPATPPGSSPCSGEIEQACTEAGWQWTPDAGSGMRVDIPTRARHYPARLEPVSSGAWRFVVELVDLAGSSGTSARAVAALLMATAASVHSVGGLVVERDGTRLASLAAPLEMPLDGSVDRALSALAVACGLAGREAIALRDAQLASAYLGLWEPANAGVRPLVHRKKGSDPFFKEEEPCLEQQA